MGRTRTGVDLVLPVCKCRLPRGWLTWCAELEGGGGSYLVSVCVYVCLCVRMCVCERKQEG